MTIMRDIIIEWLAMTKVVYKLFGIAAHAVEEAWPVYYKHCPLKCWYGDAVPWHASRELAVAVCSGSCKKCSLLPIPERHSTFVALTIIAILALYLVISVVLLFFQGLVSVSL